jgi:hypothetical protein
MSAESKTIAQVVAEFVSLLSQNTGNKVSNRASALMALARRTQDQLKTVEEFANNLKHNPQYAFNWMRDAKSAAQELDLLCKFYGRLARRMKEQVTPMTFDEAFKATVEHMITSSTAEILENLTPLGCDAEEYHKAQVSLRKLFLSVQNDFNK